MPKREGLTPKERAFVREYLVDLNGTQAAIRAGYSPHRARQLGSAALRRPVVAAAIEAAMVKRAARVEVTADYVLTNLTEVVERCMQRAPVMVRSGRALAQKVDEDGRHVWQFDAKGANGALTLLGKHLGLYTEKLEHSGAGGGPLTVNVVHEVIDPRAG